MEIIDRVKQMIADGVLKQEDAEKYIPELKESEDERIRIELLNYLYDVHDDDEERASWMAWLKKQGEHYQFRQKIQIGDQVTKNEDGVLVNLSQLKRVAKPADEKQGEQKPAWNEEDNVNLIRALVFIKNTNIKDVDEIKESVINWLKSFKDKVQRKQWKPSEEQMVVLNDIIINGHLSNANEIILKDLQEQLKKLKIL